MTRWTGPYTRALDAATLSYAMQREYNRDWREYLTSEEVEEAVKRMHENQDDLIASFRWCPCMGPWCEEATCFACAARDVATAEEAEEK